MPEREAERIEREIERTRAEMSETIDALERKLSPGELFDELWTRIRGGETGSNVADTIRDHPVPLAMMGLGLGWLAIEKATESRTEQLRARHGYGSGTYERAEGRVGPYRGEEIIDPDYRYDDGPGVADRVREAASGMKDRVTDLAGETKDRVSGMAAEARDRASEMTSGARDRMADVRPGHHGGDGGGHAHTGHTRSSVYGDISAGSGRSDGPGLRDRASDLREGADRQMHHARERLHDGGRRVSHGFQRALEDYPLALGAVSFGLGLAAGLGIPTTERENRLMGDASDTLKDEVKRTAQETAAAARDVASEATHAARQEVESEGMGDDLRSKAERVVEAATRTAREQAEQKGLTSEGMGEKVREIGHSTTSSASGRDRGGSGI